MYTLRTVISDMDESCQWLSYFISRNAPHQGQSRELIWDQMLEQFIFNIQDLEQNSHLRRRRYMNQESLFRGRCQEIVGEGDDRWFEEGVSRKVSRNCWGRRRCFDDGVSRKVSRNWGRRRWAGESWGSPRLCVSRIQTQLPLRWRGSSKQAHQLISAPPSSYPTLP